MFNDDRSTTATSTPRRRWRFWLLLLGIPLLIVILSGVAWVYQAKSALQTAIAEADRSDSHWRLEDIEADRATPPPAENAADRIAAMYRLRPGKSWWDNKKYDLVSDVQAEHRLNDQQIAALKDLMGPIGPALAEARSLIDTPRGRFMIIYAPDWVSTNLNGVQTTREAAALLKFDVIDKAEAGDFDGAVRSCHAMFHAGCSVGDEPCMIAQLVRIACQAIAVGSLERTLAQGEPSDAVLKAFQDRLEAAEPEPLLLYGLRGERAGGHQFFQNIGNGTIPAGNAMGSLGITGGAPAPMNYFLSLPGFITIQHAGHLRYMTEMIEVAKLPPEQWAGPLAAQQAKVSELPSLAKLLVPAVDKMANACQRNHANLRCAIVAIAAERFRRAKGQWPATPDDLVKAGLLKSAPTDPYAAGQSIRFARPSDGLIIYSTGMDGVDNGGKLDPLDRAATKPGADLGFRLWDVAARRQAPLPPKP